MRTHIDSSMSDQSRKLVCPSRNGLTYLATLIESKIERERDIRVYDTLESSESRERCHRSKGDITGPEIHLIAQNRSEIDGLQQQTSTSDDTLRRHCKRCANKFGSKASHLS